MSWIHNHVRHYVVPGIFALAAAQRKHDAKPRTLKTPAWGQPDPGLSVLDEVRPPKNLRPAKGYKTKELGLIATALKSSGTKITTTMHKALGYKGIGTRRVGLSGHRTGVDALHNTVKNSLRSLRRILKKHPERRLILPGRDVWMWSVLAHKMSVPHVFDPRISRGVARNEAALMSIISKWNLDPECIIFDTGFAGSIYEKIVQVSGIKCHNLMLSTARIRKGHKEQLWPNHRGARSKALAIEYLPKYQLTGTVIDGRPVQYMADPDTFVQAACLTVWFWYHKSPRWINQGGERCKVVDCNCRSCNLWKEGHLPVKM